MITNCPTCQSSKLGTFLEQKEIPTNSYLMLRDQDQALSYPTGNMALTLCDDCGYIFNAAFIPDNTEYSESYEASQGSSKVFMAWLEVMAAEFVKRNDLQGKTIFEVGCGQGEFLAMATRASGGKGIGIDPAYKPGFIDEKDALNLEFINDFFNESTPQISFDAIAHRHTLEHIIDVAPHSNLVLQAAAKNEAKVFFELPEMKRILTDLAFWDIYYEHCNYFTPGSLSRLLRSQGLGVTHLATEYDDQYCCLEGVMGEKTEILPLEDDLDEVKKLVDQFSINFPKQMEELGNTVSEFSKPIIWGAGSKGTSFLTNLGLGMNELGLVVDIDKHKHGTFMAKTGQPVQGPDALIEYQPDLVVAMNSIYLDEIQADLDSRGVNAKLIGV
ncbi:MAG TPA: class I SAM-dependent methyltransferase [Acidimicrobiia bacterium]|nr:class I SAM-dependent methyltransferase [Acidimicrobiia bacterium]